jgi:response regulator RpfG family c-di-GMP phosphodiesterase
MTSDTTTPRSEIPVPRSKVLVVDDERSIRLTVRAILQDQGYEVEIAEDGTEAQALLSNGVWDVVVTDIVLPRVSGVELLKTIRAAAPDVQVIMMTGEPTVETATEAVRAGACDYLTKPVGRSAILRAVATAVQMKKIVDEKRRLQKENHNYQETLEQLVAQRTAELRQALDGFIHAMAVAVESRDPYTAGHQHRVAELARRIAQEMDLPEETILGAYFAGMIHDLGKISVPAEILSSPAKLSKAAMDIIREHPATAFEILKGIAFPWPIAEIVRQHHERLDGSGYPQGLSGNAISIEARILAVADVVEAMASHRPYRPTLGIEAALAEIVERRSTWFDPDVVAACVRLFREKGFKLGVPLTAAGGTR